MPYAAPTHKHQRPLFLKKEDRARYDLTRGTAAERGYDGKWRRARIHFLQHYPLCEICMSNGQYEAATNVHHRKKVADHPDLFWDSDLWQSLCHSCHSRLTAAGE